jgi:glucuronate isomerase
MDRLKDRHDTSNSRFRNFAKASENAREFFCQVTAQFSCLFTDVLEKRDDWNLKR